MDLNAFEEVVTPACENFVEAGLALGQIRDRRLWIEFPSFDAYCRAKWQMDRDYADRRISAAQVFTQLPTSCRQHKPEYEFQVRPLIGLPPEQVNVAWERAVKKAGGGKITARLIKNAVKELQPAGPAPTTPKPADQPTKSERRQLISAAIGELLLLVSQKANHDVLTAKIEKLHGHIQGLFSAAAPKRTRGAAV